ncbi:MAG TPA: HAMP domain-containing sensor histidine kinase [Candidatus Binatia bacterium]
MEALCNSTTAPPRSWKTVARAIRKRISRVRLSTTILGGCFAVYAVLLLASAEAFAPLAFVRSLGPVTIALLYIYLARSEDMEQSINERTALGRREARHAEEKTALFDEMKRQEELLDRANSVKDQFLGMVSHELRTPLNVIVGYTRLLKERMLGELDPIQADAIAKIDSHARAHLAMIADLLEITSLNAGRNASRCQEISLSGLLDDLKAYHDVPRGKEVELVWSYPENLPVVRTDGEKVKHILRNVIDNAIKFTARGSVKVAARMVAAPAGISAEKQYVEFTVADTGIGVAPEELSRIFDRFHQIDSSNTRHYGGLGMGLYVVQRLAALLGASVQADSALGHGSTFIVTLGCEPSTAERFSRRSVRRESVADGDVHLRL